MTLPASAQTPAQTTRAFAIETVAAGYRSDHPEGGPIGLGLALSLEHRITQRTVLRYVLNVLETLVTADDISLCHPRNGGCVPDSIFPGRLWIGEMSLLFQPSGQLPLLLLAGGGAVVPVGKPKGHGVVDNPDADAGASASWRLGLEVRLGSSPRAPRLHLSRLGLLRDMMSLEGLVALALQLRLD